ncbi:MAG: hypothetical protein JXO22_09940, partial [Phycisphaerae bacterium]|nr:hypothetical protein [Phycisphaerae bacterium]
MGAASGTQTNTQRQRGGRRRVTRVVLRLVTVVFVIGLALVMTLYVWATRPARLREAVTGVFDRLHGAHAVVGDVSFTPWDGLSVERLRIVYDESREATQPVRADQLPPIADVGDAHIRCDWRALLTGRFEPTEIRANSAQINAIHDVSGLNSLDILPEEEPGAPHHARHYLPFAIEHVDVNLWTVADGALRLSERWRLAARGEARQPAVRQGDYVVRLHPVGEPLTSLAELKLGAADSVVDLSVNWLSLRTAKLTSTLWPTAGDRVRQILDQFDLRGEVQLTRLRATGTELTDISIALRGVSGSLPIEAVSNADGSLASLGPEQRFLRFTDGTGTLQLRDIALDGRVTVLLNGEPATLSLSCIPPADAPVIEFGGAAPAFERWGVTIDARLTRVAFPTRTEQPDFVESPRLPHSVRAFFRDYDPHGDFEFEVSATRPPGDADESTKQSWDYEARVAALGASCSYYRFPLLVDDIQGGFRVRNNVIAFTDLTARHGAGRIYVSGTLDEPRNWTGFDLRFRAANMPLDENLYEALSPMYRRLWDDARPIGLCDLDVELSRGPGSRDTGPSPTDTRVTARLLAGSVAFDHQRLGHCDGVVTIE